MFTFCAAKLRNIFDIRKRKWDFAQKKQNNLHISKKSITFAAKIGFTDNRPLDKG